MITCGFETKSILNTHKNLNKRNIIIQIYSKSFFKNITNDLLQKCLLGVFRLRIFTNTLCISVNSSEAVEVLSSTQKTTIFNNTMIVDIHFKIGNIKNTTLCYRTLILIKSFDVCYLIFGNYRIHFPKTNITLQNIHYGF